MYIELIILIVSLYFLIKGSDILVNSAASIAKKLNLSKFIIGLTLIAIGTSVPELASSISAALNKSSGLIIGNVIGSNIANICLVIGLACIYKNIKSHEKIITVDSLMLLFTTSLFFVFLYDGRLIWIEGIFMLLIYIVYLIFSFEKSNNNHFREFVIYFLKLKYLVTIKSKLFSKSNKQKSQVKQLFKEGLIKDTLLSILGLIIVVYSAKYLVAESIYFARLFNISEFIIGAVILAIGTSLPELSVTISAVKKGFGDMATGNIIGSNIANILLVSSTSTLINTIELKKILMPLIILFIITIIFVYFVRQKQMTKKHGIILLAIYILFILQSIFFN